MNAQMILDFIREAKGKGLDPEEFVQQKIAARRQSDDEEIWVQIMPRCSLGGIGRYPARVQLPRHKALALARNGKVFVLGSTPQGGLSEDIPWWDKRAARLLKDVVEVRKSADRGPDRTGEKQDAQLTRWDDERFNPDLRAERERSAKEQQEPVLVPAGPQESRTSRREARG